MGYPALLRVLEEEASREAREVRAAADQEATRIVAAARAMARTAREALLARERLEVEVRGRAARESLGMERDRALLVESRRQLDALKAEVLRRAARAPLPGLDARLLEELAPELGDGPIEVVVDPGAEDAARAVLARVAPRAALRATVRAAPVRRGGVEVAMGRLVLDDTLPARVERAWPDVEAEVAALLFGEG